jgi:ABC-type multidrug transport system fused ATPase/permease subunit
MKLVKELVKKYLKHFAYFYTYLRHRMFVALMISLTVATLDGFGLAMFMPLLQMADGSQQANPETLGNLRFLVDGINAIGLDLTVTTVLLVIAVFYAFKGVGRFIEAYYKVILSRYFIKKLRFANIEKLSNYSYKSFVMADVGRIQNTLSAEITKILHAYKSYFMTVQAAVMVFVYVILAFLANPQFALIVVAGATLSNVVYRRIYKRTKEASKKLTKSGHKFQALLIQKVTHFKYLKATGFINVYAKKLKEVILETEAITKKMGWYNAILSSTKEPLVVMVVVVVVLIQVNYFGESIGVIVLSLLFFYRSLTFLMNVQTQWNAFLHATGSLENMTEFMNELQASQEKFGKKTLETFRKSIELRNVGFSYGAKEILRDFNLTINKNETIAFVGESGSGKTTLVNLVAGLMPIDHGVFTIDGVNAKEIDIRKYQRRIGYITQEPVIFSDSIYNNVTFWAEKTQANLDKFWLSLEKASIADFVRGVSGQEESLLGNNGILVSGGQKQRISIARELYKDIDILIMDEATSALDSETERVIQQNIDALKGKYTILIVAHRLATIKNADRVVLLSKGKIESIGTFDELKHSSRLFEKMVELQEI